MIDYNSARAVVEAAAALDAPMIVQVSVKTIKHWGFKPIGTWVRMLAEAVDVPVALHLDHCNSVDVIKGCIDAGWTSVMFDGSSLPFAENKLKSEAVYRITEAAGVSLEAEIGAIGGVEDDKFVAEDAAILANYDECISFVENMPNLGVFAPAIGTAHGFYKGQPKIAYDLLKRITATIPIPIALHGGTGLSQEQFDKCIAAGCAKVNISTMHKHRFIEGFMDVGRNNPKQQEPLPFIAGQYEAMKKDVCDMIVAFGSKGRAAHAAGAA
jgi:ketose-bisphosphate aldolase